MYRLFSKMVLGLSFASQLCFSFNSLSESYCVRYGSADASVQVREYFSFDCPHCIAIFREYFYELEEAFVANGHASYEFHPVPMDLATVQAMICLSQLNDEEKKVFLEALLMELSPGNGDVAVLLMKKAMEFLGHPVPDLGDMGFVSGTQAYEDAFGFISQADCVKAVPNLEINQSMHQGPLDKNSAFEALRRASHEH